MPVNRMNICIELPAIPNMDRASIGSFPDMLRYIQALAEQTKEDAEASIADAKYKYNIEWNVEPKLFSATVSRHSPELPAKPDTSPMAKHFDP